MLDEQEEYDLVVNANNAFKKKIVTSLDDLAEYSGLAQWLDSIYRFEVYIYSEVFKKVLKFSALLEDGNKTVPEKEYLSVINQFLSFDSKPLLSLIQNELWAFCENLFSYMECDENSEGQSNYDFLGIHTKEEAYNKSKMVEVIVDFEDNTFEIKLDIDLNWESRFVFSRNIENGSIIINA